MYSLSYLYQALGDNEYADRCELTAFNALPVMTTSNQWARQYVVLANQPVSYHLNGATPFFNVGQDGIVYGLGKCIRSSCDVLISCSGPNFLDMEERIELAKKSQLSEQHPNSRIRQLT